MGKLPALILISFCFAITANAQGPATLQLGTPIERALGPGQVHEFTVKLEENTYVQVAVEQRGIDVIVKVFSPPGKSLGEFDSPTGNEGSENVSFVAAVAGSYRITVGPLDPGDSTEGRYQIKLLELRQATDQELKTSKNQEVVKAKGLALLTEAEALISQIKSPQTRIRSQLQAAQLLWESDEKRASKYLSDAIAGAKEFFATFDPDSQQYFEQYSAIAQLRYEIVQMLAGRDAEAALSFLHSTVVPANPSGNQQQQLLQESELELRIANQIIQSDPKRAVEIMRENLKTSFPPNQLSTLSQLQRQRPDLATELANEIAAKLLNEKLLKDQEAAILALNLLRLSQSPQRRFASNPPVSRAPLLTDDTYRELFRKLLAEALSYPKSSSQGMERETAFTLLTGLPSVAEVDRFVPGAAAAIEKKLAEVNQTANPQVSVSQDYQAVLANSPADAALEAIAKAPAEMKENLYMQLATREAMNGDSARAKQIVNDHISTPYQRRQALLGIEQQQIYRAMTRGKVDEALAVINSLRTPRERAVRLAELANQIGPGQKRASAISLLEQARSMLSASVQAEDEDQMRALLEIARALSRYDTKRAFEIVDPLVDQINELCTAARALDGFGQQYFADEELNLQNGTGVANVASYMSSVLGSLALTNFERAKAAADRIRLPEVRLRTYLEIAQQTSQAAK